MSASWKAASLAERLRLLSDIQVRVCAWAAARLLSPSRLPGAALLKLQHGTCLAEVARFQIEISVSAELLRAVFRQCCMRCCLVTQLVAHSSADAITCPCPT